MNPSSSAKTTDHPPSPKPAGPRLGHVALGVSNLDRATRFYRELIGLELTSWGPDSGVPLAVLAQGGHPLGVVLMAFDTAGSSPPPPGHTGLAHLALVLDGPDELARVLGRLLDAGHPVDRASDHHATVSVYLSDSEGNGLELCYERSPEHWAGPDGELPAVNDPLDLETVLSAKAG